MITIAASGNPLCPVTPIPVENIGVRCNGSSYSVYMAGDTVPPIVFPTADPVVTKYQFMKALQQTAFYDKVLDGFESQTDATQVALENADVFYRSATGMITALSAAGMTPTDIDNLFTVAATLPPTPPTP